MYTSKIIFSIIFIFIITHISLTILFHKFQKTRHPSLQINTDQCSLSKFTALSKILYYSLYISIIVGEVVLAFLTWVSYSSHLIEVFGFKNWTDIGSVFCILYVLVHGLWMCLVVFGQRLFMFYQVGHGKLDIEEYCEKNIETNRDLKNKDLKIACRNIGIFVYKSSIPSSMADDSIDESVENFRKINKLKRVFKRMKKWISETNLSDNVSIYSLSYDTLENIVFFEHSCVRFVYDGNDFISWGQEKDISNLFNKDSRIENIMKNTEDHTNKTISFPYTLSPHSEESYVHYSAKSGLNRINVQVPSIFTCLVEEFHNIIYIFQLLGSWAYIFWSTWNIGLIWLFLLIGSGTFKALCIIRPNIVKISKMAKSEEDDEICVFREGKWRIVQSIDICVGDVIGVVEGKMATVDSILISGYVCVDESSLTGEPLPIAKFPIIENEENVQSKLSSYKSNIDKISKQNEIYAGSKILSASGSKYFTNETHNIFNPKTMAIAKVTSIGGESTKGSLIRLVLFPLRVRFKYSDQLPTVYFIMMVYAFVSSIPLFFMATGDWVVNFLLVTATIAQVINPMLPVSLVMGQSSSVQRLNKNKEINCLAPDRIPIAGKVSTMVFDKTGTITKEGIDFIEGVRVRDSIILSNLDASEPIYDLLSVGFGCCHSVTSLSNGDLVGNHVEVSMFKHSRYSFMKTLSGEYDFSKIVPEHRNRKVLPINIHRILEFDQTRVTSGSVVEVDGKTYCFIKGSYEKIRSLCHNVPVNYDAFCEEKASENYYVLSMAVKEITDVNMSRDEFEKDLELIGILLFRNEIKPDSAKAINDLKIGNTNCIICTGDNALTGTSIGLQCGILSEDKRILHIEEEANGSFIFKNHCSGEMIAITKLNINDQLIVSGNVFKTLKRTGQLASFSDRIKVYARMKPNDKVDVITHYQQVKKLVVGMCGDGGNDCGALRAAHIGHALSEGEASMVAPFSSGRDGKSLQTVVDIIREGRACLSTNLATFQYFMVYAFLVTFTKVYLMGFGNITMSELMYMFTDLYIGIFVVWGMTKSGPLEHVDSYCWRWMKNLFKKRENSIEKTDLMDMPTDCSETTASSKINTIRSTTDSIISDSSQISQLPRVHPLSKSRPTASLLGIRTLGTIGFFVILSLCTFLFTVIFVKENSSYESWYEHVNTLDLHISPRDWMKKGDNYDAPLGTMFVMTVLCTTGFCLTFGGKFRVPIYRNLPICFFYLLSLFIIYYNLLETNSNLNCMFRINCDYKASLNVFAPVISSWSVGGVGGCFLGPQVQTWQHLMINEDPDWTPTVEKNCLPPENILSIAPVESLSSIKGCVGPNNCYSSNFKLVLFLTYTSLIAVLMLFSRFILNGSTCIRLCSKRRRNAKL